MTKEQEEEFAQRGFLLLHGRLSAEELALLRDGRRELLVGAEERLVREHDSTSIRSIYGIHTGDSSFAQLARLDKIVDPARRLLAGEVYVYQSKLNVKSPFVGDRWDWHQDYAFWRAEDAMIAPHVLTAAVYLDEINEFNGSIVVIPGSHRGGLAPCRVWERSPEQGDLRGYTSASLKYTVELDEVARLVGMGGLVAPKGPAGSVLLFSGSLVHASGVNISPFARSIALYTYNRVDNAPKRAPRRPWFLHSREVQAIVPVCSALKSS